MESIKKQELEEIFVDVRKAYRLLYEQQRRNLDIIKYIKNLLKEGDFKGWSLFSDSPPKNNNLVYLDWSAWDWLPGYFYEYSLEAILTDGTKVGLGLSFMSDSGFYETNMESFKDIETFTDVRVKNKFVNLCKSKFMEARTFG